MLIVGWADGYRNNSFRVVEQYGRNGLPWRLLAGPWVHQSPERARPGPNVDDDLDVMAFFDQHLRDGDRRGRRTGPGVRAPAGAPEPDLAFHPGRWVDLDAWPPAGLRTARSALGRRRRSTRWRSSATSVFAAWNSCGGGLPWGQPLDQRADNARSLTYDWPIADARRAGRHARGRAAGPRRSGRTATSASSCATCAPTASSALITRGMLDLRHRGCWPADPAGAVGRRPSPRPRVSGSTSRSSSRRRRGRSCPATVRLAVAGTDWPNCWPRRDRSRSTSTSRRSSSSCRWSTCRHRTRVRARLRAHRRRRRGRRVANRARRARPRDAVATRYGGTYDGLHGAVVTDDYRGELGVSTVDPARAWARGTRELRDRVARGHRHDRGDPGGARPTTRPFEVTITLRVRDGDDEIADRTWHRRSAALTRGSAARRLSRQGVAGRPVGVAALDERRRRRRCTGRGCRVARPRRTRPPGTADGSGSRAGSGSDRASRR